MTRGSRRHRAAARAVGLLSGERLNRFTTTALRAGHRLLGVRPHAIFPTALGRRGITAVPLPNGKVIRFDSRGDEWSTNLLYWYGWDGFETPQARAFFRLALDARTVLDIGAHSGYYSLLAAHANRRATVYAFEPLPVVFNRLVRNVQLNETPNIVAVKKAASTHAGHATLLLPAEMSHPGIATLEPQHAREFQTWDPTLETDGVAEIDVELVALDEWCSENEVPVVDLVKVDVEQHEASVLAGMHEVIHRDRPDLFCEVLNLRSGNLIRDALRGFGYSWFALTATQAVAVPEGGDPILSREHFLSARGTLPDVSMHV